MFLSPCLMKVNLINNVTFYILYNSSKVLGQMLIWLLQCHIVWVTFKTYTVTPYFFSFNHHFPSYVLCPFKVLVLQKQLLLCLWREKYKRLISWETLLIKWTISPKLLQVMRVHVYTLLMLLRMFTNNVTDVV